MSRMANVEVSKVRQPTTVQPHAAAAEAVAFKATRCPTNDGTSFYHMGIKGMLARERETTHTCFLVA